MLVDVVCLRNKGVKRGREEVLLTRPVRGDLTLHAPCKLHMARPRPAAELLSGDGIGRHVLPPLDPARVSRIRGESFVVVGVEEYEGVGKVRLRFAQAWWCRPVRRSQHEEAQFAELEYRQRLGLERLPG